VRAIVVLLHSAFCFLHLSSTLAAQTPSSVTDVVVEQEGRRVTDPVILDLIQTRPGTPFSVKDASETIDHLYSLNRFDDVVVETEAVGGGLRVRYLLTPLHPVDRIEFEGMLGLPEETLRRVVVDRFGASPRAGLAMEISEALRMEYRRRGYSAATVASRVVETHDPDRASLIFQVQAGRRLTIADVKISQVDAEGQSGLLERPDVRPGQPLDEDVIDRTLRAWEETQQARGYYEARASHGVQIVDDSAYVTVNLFRGPHVTVTFTGDPLPEAERDRLVPIRAQGTADEDLLEDSSRAIETYLHERGYRDADAAYTRDERDGELVITFHINRGPRFFVRSVSVMGNDAIPDADLLPLVRLKTGAPFVRSALATGTGAIERLYRSKGYTTVQVKATENVVVPERLSDDRPTDVVIAVEQGPQTIVRSVTIAGNESIDDATLRGITTIMAGAVYSAAAVAADRDRIELEYRNRGYDSAAVAADLKLAENNTQADVVFRVVEGSQAIVDHIIITGNRRISTDTIRRELLLQEGRPLGYSDLLESRSRLVALQLFRRVQISPLPHGGEARRDVLVEVEESPPTTLDFGGGVEGGYILRPTGEGGVAEERLELAPRGFVQIGRRNIWGKNRSVNLFTRVSRRSRDLSPTDPSQPVEPAGSTNFWEYRVLGQFREPRVFSTRADLLLTGIDEQAKRSSFSFARREARAQVGLRLSRLYSFLGLYSFQKTRLFDTHFTPEEAPIIDRLFSSVRLSKVSGSVIRDSRDDLLDPSGGTLVSVDGEVAARAMGSEVGFVKTYLQGFYYRRLPLPRRLVVALGARVGAAHGFPREVDDQIVQDLPASERFFAGGDTSVRGFSLDRLGNEQTITPSGFPTGGNSVVVLNSELRLNVIGPFSAVGFVDAGNVFPKASDLDFTDLRPSAGFGVMYKSPVGPIRVDLGFNLDPRELVPGTLERRSVLHILLGQAF